MTFQRITESEQMAEESEAMEIDKEISCSNSLSEDSSDEYGCCFDKEYDINNSIDEDDDDDDDADGGKFLLKDCVRQGSQL